LTDPSHRTLNELPLSPPGSVPRYELSEWMTRFGLLAGLTGRGGAPPFNLGLSTSEPAAVVTARWRTFRDSFRPRFTSFHVAHQVHGATILEHSSPGDGWHIHDDADGHTTARAGVLLSVTLADCVPVYVAAADSGAFALLHCGWRSIAAGLLEAALERLGGGRSALAVHLGVGICGKCYEVGPEVIAAVERREAQGKAPLDLRAALATRARGTGVRDISCSGLCPSCERDRFFSHRAGSGGRMVAYLGRPLSVS
jgi:copper oxidase (laccase) domain-containing protein